MRLLATLALVGAFVAGAAFRYRPPAPKPPEAPAHEFSAGRAREVLRRLVGEGQPHPTGSAADGRVRGLIVAELARLGYQPRVQESFACGSIGICARVANVIARLDGTRAGKAVLLSVHYDSVPAGPGASDDGVGVAAALEVARALKQGRPAANPIVLLFNEGEEDDLLGAEAFVASDMQAAQIGAVVNLEARGTTGASLMFETSDESGWLVDLFARSVDRPASNSIYYTVYKLLPNDTDLTVYKRRRIPGLNFAFIGGEARYHTPRDDFAHADPASLQHHGDNALAMVRSLGEAELEAPPHGELVFFDVLAFAVVRWPLRWMLPLAILAALLWLAGAARAIRRGDLRRAAIGAGLAAWALAVLLTGAAAYVSLLALRTAGAAPYPFVAHPGFARAAFLAVPVLGTAVAALTAGRGAGAAGLWWGTWAGWAIAGLATAIASPGLSYPFVLPTGIAALCGLLPGAHARWAGLVPPLAAAAIVFCPVAWLLYDALGVPVLPGSSTVLALVLGAGAVAWLDVRPRLRRAAVGAAGAVAALALLAAAVAPPFSADNPRKLNLWYRLDAGTGEARWLASASTGRLPREMAGSARFREEAVAALEWAPGVRAYVAPAPATPLAPPELSVERQGSTGGTRSLRARLRSPRGARLAGIALPAARVASVRMEGVLVRQSSSKNRAGAAFGDGRAWRGYVCTTTGAGGVQVDLELSGADPVDAYVWDASSELPAEAEPLLTSRPEWAVPFQTGDRALVVAKLRL